MPFTLPEYYTISTDKNLIDVHAVHHYLSVESYWAKNIPLTTVEKCIENSLCFGVYFKNSQIGFARIITDYGSFAYLCDLYILDAHRGKKLSKCLLQEIMQHAQLQGLRRWILATADAHELYRQFGWNNPSKPKRYMEIARPNIYLSK
jgi:GNAT superfamily N-acetyltransferase